MPKTKTYTDTSSGVLKHVTVKVPKKPKRPEPVKVTRVDAPIAGADREDRAAESKAQAAESAAQARRRKAAERAKAAMERRAKVGPPKYATTKRTYTDTSTGQLKTTTVKAPTKRYTDWQKKQAELIARAEGTITEDELEHFKYKPPSTAVKGQNVDPDLKKALADDPDFAKWYAKPKAMPKAFWDELTPAQKAAADDRLYDIWWNSRTAEQKTRMLRRAEDLGLQNRAIAAQRAGRVKPWMSPEERAKLERAIASGAMSEEDEAKARRLLRESSGSKVRFDFIRQVTPGRRDILKQMHQEMSPWEMASTMGGVAADWAGGKFNIGVDDLADVPGQVLRGVANTPEKLWGMITEGGPGIDAAKWAAGTVMDHPKAISDFTRWLGEGAWDAGAAIVKESARNRKRYGWKKGMAANFLDATDWVDPTIEWGAGANIHKALKGEDFSEAGLMFEAAMFFVPIKGLPSVGSVALRALLARPLERSLIADSYRASKAVRLLAKLDKTEPAAAAAMRLALDQAPKRSDEFQQVVRTIDRTWRADKMGRAVASSTVSKIMGDTAKKVGMPGPLVKWIYNDPRALRMFQSENGQDALWLLPARSRTGKGFEQLMDWARPQLSKVPLVKTEQEKWSQAVARDIRYKENVWLSNVSLLQKALGKNFWHRLKIPEMYAIRMVGKGIDPARAIDMHRTWAKEAMDAGDTLGALLNERHADNFQRAAHLVEEKMDGTIGFIEGDVVRPRVRKVYSAMERAAGGREQILEKLHLLNANEMELRIANEQLLYHGARFTDTRQFVEEAIMTNPNRKKLYEILRRNGEQVDAEALIAALDAMAFNSYARAIERTKLLLARTEAEITQNPTDPTLPVKAKQLRDRLAVGIRPDVFWEKMIDVIDELPPDLKQAYMDRYGEDMLFQFENESTRPMPELLVEDVHNALESGGVMDRETAEAVVEPNFTPQELAEIDYAVDAAFPHDYQLPAGVTDAFIPRLENRHAGGLKREAAITVERTKDKVKTKVLLTGPEAAAENARRAPGGDLYDPDLGHPTLRPLYRQVGGQKIQITGQITPENWMRRVIAAFKGDYEEIDKAARWYESFDATMRHFFAEDAEAVMRGLAASQANASPKDGLTATLKVIYKMRRGIGIGADEISAAVNQIKQAVSDETITVGFAAKLHDFTDSLEGKGTRTWMDNIEDMGWPTANDIHALRDLGYVDEKLIYRLRNPQEITRGYRQGAMYKRGFTDKDIPDYDSGGSPGDHQYWRMTEKYQEITDYLNREDVAFMGRRDWNPSQVQALGWSSIQRIHGAHPENLLDAVMGNTRLVAMEVTQGPGGIGRNLSQDQADAVAREMEPFFKELVDDTDDVYWIPDQVVQFMPGGWSQGQNTSVIFRVAGALEAVEALLVRLARAFDQGLVQASRETSSASANPRAAFVFTSPDFADPVQKQRYFARLNELAVENKWANDFDGYVSYEDVMGEPSIMIRSGRPAQTGQAVAKFRTRYKGIIRKAARDTGVDVTHVHRNVALLIGDQLGPRDAKTTFEQARAVGADDLENPLERRIRATLADRVSVYQDALAQDPEEITQSLAQLAPIPETGPSVYLADTQSFAGGHIRKPAVYLRFGELPTGASQNHLTGELEPGVSVYAAWFDQNTGKYVLPGGGEQLLATQGEIGAGRAHAIYQVEGKELTEVGDDGEPLLRVGTPKVIAAVRADDIVTENDPWLTLSGRELDPSETPDWHPRQGPGSGDVDIEGRLIPRGGRLDESVDFVYHQFTDDGALPNHLPLAPEPGSSPLKPGYVRLYHYTRLGDRERIAKIANEGIRLDEAKGMSYGEPNAVWASTEKPERGEYIEFAVHVNDPRWDIGKYTPGTTHPFGADAGKPFTPETYAEYLMARKGNYTFRADITPEDFLTVQESWMEHARYLGNEVGDTDELAERFGWIMDAKGGLDEDYQLAYRYLEKTLPGKGEVPMQLGQDPGPKLMYQASDLLDEWDDGPRIRAKVKDVPRDVKGVLVPVIDQYGQPDMMALDFKRRVAPYYFLQSSAGYGHVLLNGDEEVLYVMPRYLKDMEILGSMTEHPRHDEWDAIGVRLIATSDPLREAGHLSNDELGDFSDWAARYGDELKAEGEHPDVYNAYYDMAEEANKLREPLNQLTPEEEARMDFMLGKSGEKLAKDLPGYAEAAHDLQHMQLPVDFLKRLVAHPTLSDYEKQRIAIHLNNLSGNVLKQNVDAISRRSVPGLNQIISTGTMHLKGMYNPNDHRMFIGSKGKAPTALHEMVHYMHKEGVLPDNFMYQIEEFLQIPRDAKGDAQWTQQNAEDLAHIFEAMVIRWDETSRELTPELRKVMKDLRTAVLKDVDPHTARYMANGQRPLPTELIDAVEGLFAYQKLTGKGWHGATDYVGRGKMYLPEVPGFPISISGGMLMMKAYGLRFSSYLRRGQVSHLRQIDKRIEKRFTGSLIRSGRFSHDVISGTLETQMKAARLNAMFELRQRALRIATDRPERPDDIAVVKDLDAWKKDPRSRTVALYGALVGQLDQGKRIDEQTLVKMDWSQVEQAKNSLFWGMSKETEAEAAAFADALFNELEEPIENVVWVNRKALMDTDIFAVPAGVGKGKARHAAEWAIDATNDYLKASMLLMNPAYYPMNVVGNAGMMMMSQGALAPLNTMRAAKIHYDIGEYAFLIDHFVGGGLMTPYAMSNALRMGKISGLLQDTANMLVDRIPRRAEFIYQARKLGYEGSEEILELLINPKHADDLRIAAERVKAAMVDFDDLSQFEKDVMSRWIFVYPWLKGASVWTARFPKDHPLQAMAYAYLFYYQQQRLSEEVGEQHPDYLSTFIPFSMLPGAVQDWQVPGTDYQPFEATVERHGEEYPRGVSGRQLFTFTTPYDLLRVATGWLTNAKDAQMIVEMANPIYGEIAKQVTGYDSFKKQEVERGPWAAIIRMFPGGEATILAENIRRAQRDETTRARSLYPTTATEDWMRVFLGSIFPVPINPEVAQKTAGRGALNPAQRTDEWIEEGEEALGREIPPDVRQLKLVRNEYYAIMARYKKELNKTSLDDNEILAARAEAFGILYPERKADALRWAEDWKNTPKETITQEDLDTWADYLGWEDLNTWEAYIKDAKEAELAAVP